MFLAPWRLWGLSDARGVATPGTNEAGGPNAGEISELRGTAKWHEPLQESSVEKN